MTEPNDGFQQQLQEERLAFEISLNFDEWWANIGSGITPKRGDDMEEHAHRIAREAWLASFNRRQP